MINSLADNLTRILVFFMPRQPRLDTPGALHHVMGRGIERKKIFREDFDREDCLTRLTHSDIARVLRVIDHVRRHFPLQSANHSFGRPPGHAIPRLVTEPRNMG